MQLASAHLRSAFKHVSLRTLRCRDHDRRTHLARHPFSREPPMTLHLPALTTLIAILLYAMTLANVAFPRHKYKMPPPGVSGNDAFERVFRVQMNTLEQLVAFLPALWLFALYVSPAWSSVIGAVCVVGRGRCPIGYP